MASDERGLAAFEPTCSNHVCHQPVAAVVEHPRHGRRAVCESHADDFEVIDG